MAGRAEVEGTWVMKVWAQEKLGQLLRGAFVGTTELQVFDASPPSFRVDLEILYSVLFTNVLINSVW